MNKKAYNILGEKGASIIREYGLSRGSKYNDFKAEVGISFYPGKGDEFRFSDHWGGQSASDELKACENSKNMILGRKVKGVYGIVKIVKKQEPHIKSVEDKVQDVPRIGPKTLINIYRELNRTGRLDGLSEDLRESLELIFPCLQRNDYSGVEAFLERYGPRIAKLANAA